MGSLLPLPLNSFLWKSSRSILPLPLPDSWPFLLLVSKKRARIRKQPRDSNDEDLNAGHDVLEPVGDGVNFW